MNIIVAGGTPGLQSAIEVVLFSSGHVYIYLHNIFSNHVQRLVAVVGQLSVI